MTSIGVELRVVAPYLDNSEEDFRNEVRGFMNRYQQDRNQEIRDFNREQSRRDIEENPLLFFLLLPLALIFILIMRACA